MLWSGHEERQSRSLKEKRSSLSYCLQMTVAAGFSSSSASPAAPSPPSVIYFLHNTLSGRSLRYVADLESRADLGTIAGFFSLNPISLRLNGHFISSSGGSGGGGGGHGCFISNLSWKQILCYFDSRGLSSGRHALSPVSVEGRPQLNDESEWPSSVLCLSIFLCDVFAQRGNGLDGSG